MSYPTYQNSHQTAFNNLPITDRMTIALSYLDRFHSDEKARPLLRFHGGDYRRWNGYSWPACDPELLIADVLIFCDQLFNSDYEEKIKAWCEDGFRGKRPVKPTVSDHLVKSVMSCLKAVTITSSSSTVVWAGADEPPWPLDECIYTAAGMVHLPAFFAGEIYLASPNPDLVNECALPFAITKDAPHPLRWHRFLSTVWPDDQDQIDCLRAWMGYLMTHRTDLQKALIVTGAGRAGKGTILEIIRALVGYENYWSAELSHFGVEYGLWPMIGKSVVAVPDADLSKMSATVSSRIKAITGGDQVSTNRKYLGYASRRPFGPRLVIASNGIPHFDDPSGIIADRFILLHFENTNLGKEDTSLLSDLLTELPGIAVWALGGLKMLNESGRFAQPSRGEEIREEMREMVSPLSGFVRDYCKVGPDESAYLDDLYDAYLLWCRKAGERTVPRANLGSQLRSLLPKIRKDNPGGRGNQRTRYTGVGLR